MFRASLLLLAFSLPLSAHDTWVQMNVAEQKAGRPFYVDLMLGNHGNGHRDFKLASKIPLKGSTLESIAPDGSKTDLIPGIVDNGLVEKEGYWTAKITPSASGLYCVSHTYDAVVFYAPKRSVKGAKTYFVSGENNSGEFSKPIGHALELIPLMNPADLSVDGKFKVRLLFKGEPLADTVVSAIPRGADLDSGFDPKHEVKTDAKGEADLPLPEANLYLFVAKKKASEETGEGYSAGTEYSAAITAFVNPKD